MAPEERPESWVTHQLPTVLLDLPPRRSVLIEEVSSLADVRVARTPHSEALLDAGRDAAVLVCRSRHPIGHDLLKQLDRLRAVVCLGSGTDVVDAKAAADLGIEVIGQAGVGATSVTEYVLGALIALRRSLVAAHRAVLDGEWTEFREEHKAHELHGSVLGVVGFGHIGRQVAHVAQLLGMEVLVWAPRANSDAIRAAGAQPIATLRLLLARCHALTVHIPLNATSEGLIGPAELAAMPPGAVLINAARGGIVDELALADALASGHLGGAAVDVLDEEPPPSGHPLLTAPNVLLTPHIAGLTDEADERLHQAAANTVMRILRKGEAHS